jgi:alkylhydroperoxidase/carboxymuconolactone decarboxylase family protein YurZ
VSLDSARPAEAGALRALGLPEADAADLAKLAQAVLGEGMLPARVKLVSAAFAAGNRGDVAESDWYMRRALGAGLTRAELMEALGAAVLSRGLGMLWRAVPWLAEAPGSAPPAAPAETTSSVAIVEYFLKTFGTVPDWLGTIAELGPTVLEGYYGLRSRTFRDGALPRKHKELLLVGLNSAERYHLGLEVHLKGAFEAGASLPEAAEAVLVGVPLGGMVSWLEAAPILNRIAAAAGVVA